MPGTFFAFLSAGSATNQQAVSFGKTELEALLNQEGCVGMRFLWGFEEKGAVIKCVSCSIGVDDGKGITCSSNQVPAVMKRSTWNVDGRLQIKMDTEHRFFFGHMAMAITAMVLFFRSSATGISMFLIGKCGRSCFMVLLTMPFARLSFSFPPRAYFVINLSICSRVFLLLFATICSLERLKKPSDCIGGLQPIGLDVVSIQPHSIKHHSF